MRFRVNILGACAGGEHVRAEISVNGGPFRSFEISRDEVRSPAPDERREVVIQRLRSVVLESGASTNAQIKAAIEAAEWQV